MIEFTESESVILDVLNVLVVIELVVTKLVVIELVVTVLAIIVLFAIIASRNCIGENPPIDDTFSAPIDAVPVEKEVKEDTDNVAPDHALDHALLT